MTLDFGRIDTILKIKPSYDTLGRLTGLKDGRTGTLIDGYSYDATGNRLSAKVGTATQAYTYPTDSHRLSSVAGVARSYDATGNTTAIGGTARQYTYDTTGRMTQARRAGAVTMNYRYNGRGEQVRRFLGTTNTYTLYDEAGHWLGDYDNNGAPKQQAIWLDDLPVGLLANASKLHYIEPDHLGSPRMVIDPTRDVAVWTWSLKGEAFGNTAPNQDPDGDGAALVLDMRFPGQRFDAASGLNQNYFRDYEAATGRYGQSDPIGLDGGINTYGYVAGQPLSLMDPTGQNSIAAGACLIPGIGWGGCAIVGATVAVGTCYVTGACQRAAQSAGNWLDEQLGALSESGLAAGPAPYDHYQENAALHFTPDPFGGDEACKKLAHAIKVLRAQISWRRTDLNPRSASYKGHSTRIAILSATLAKLESSYRNICGGNCPG